MLPGGQGALSQAEVTTEVTMEVVALLRAVQGEMPRQVLQTALGLRNAEHFRKAYLVPAIGAGWLEMTLPDQPTSDMQSNRLTPRGRQWLTANGLSAAP